MLCNLMYNKHCIVVLFGTTKEKETNKKGQPHPLLCLPLNCCSSGFLYFNFWTFPLFEFGKRKLYITHLQPGRCSLYHQLLSSLLF